MFEPSKERSGSLLGLVLIVLFVLSVTIGIFQYLAVESLRTSRLSLQEQDADVRAEGLVQLLASRWKKQLKYQATEPLSSPASGTESGIWDSEPFTLGWERDALPTYPPTYHVAVWIRFTDVRPVRTYRYDLRLNTPTALAPRVLDVTHFGLDSVDPTSQPQRAAAVADPGFASLDTNAQAAVEVLSNRLEALAARDATSTEIAATAANPGLPPAIAGVARVLDAEMSIRQEQFPSRRLNAARSLLTATDALSPEDKPAWGDLARYILAGELAHFADSALEPGRTASFQEALNHLDQVVNRGETCCGATRAAWRRAMITLRMRQDPHDPGQLASAMDIAIRGLTQVTGRAPDAAIGSYTCITRKELPPFLAGLWKARVAVGLWLNATTSLLATMLQDGTSQVVHLEVDGQIQPKAWHRDGSQIYAAVDADVWRVALDGSEIDRLPVTLPAGYSIQSIVEAPSGNIQAVGGVDSNANPTRDLRLLRGDQISPTWTTMYGQEKPYAFSPDGTRLIDYVLSPSDASLQYMRLLRVDDIFTAPAGGEPPYRRLVESNETIVGISWATVAGKDWLAYSRYHGPKGSNLQIHFANPDQVPYNPLVVTVNGPYPTTNDTFMAPNQNGIKTGHARSAGTLLTNPPGYLACGPDRFHFVPIPGSTAPIVEWPANYIGELQSIEKVDVPPWGRVVFFLAIHNGVRKVFVLDPATGMAQILVGEGGVFPGAAGASQMAVSPIPAN
jgi:hypothetical protein